jgi:hypothetical protein
MTTTLELPEVPAQAARRPPVTIAFSPAAMRRDAVRAAFPPPVLQAIDGLFTQMENQVLEPLLYGVPVHELPAAFQRQYPRFGPLYTAIIGTVLSAFEQDPQRLLTVATGGLVDVARTLQEAGPQRIGREPALAALIGIQTIGRVALRTIARLGTELPPVPDRVIAEWGSFAFAHMLSLFAVTSFLAHDEPLRGGAVNASVLARWSKEYAGRVYHLSKSMGLLRPAVAPGPIPTESDEEDLRLANAGLEHYRELLAREEIGDGRQG